MKKKERKKRIALKLKNQKINNKQKKLIYCMWSAIIISHDRGPFNTYIQAGPKIWFEKFLLLQY